MAQKSLELKFWSTNKINRYKYAFVQGKKKRYNNNVQQYQRITSEIYLHLFKCKEHSFSLDNISGDGLSQMLRFKHLKPGAVPTTANAFRFFLLVYQGGVGRKCGTDTIWVEPGLLN